MANQSCAYWLVPDLLIPEKFLLPPYPILLYDTREMSRKII
jgi:hypothetical protein